MARRDAENQSEAEKQPAAAAVQTSSISTAAPAEATSAAAPVDPRSTMIGMSARLDALESKMSAMNDKLDATRISLDNFLTAHQPKSAGVPNQASETVGMAVVSKPVSTDSESGYVNDDAIQQYRKAEILLASQKYADSTLAFSTFLEKYPDHPLAGSAQFHVGEAYFKQKEYRQAEQEFQKVLTSYDRSIHVADTLRMMADAEDRLAKTQEAARHRQQLTSLFANSPAAAQTTASAKIAEPETAVAPSEAPARANGVKPSLDEPPPTAPVTAPTNE